MINTHTIVTICFLIITYQSNAFGYDDTVTHPEISEKAVSDNVSNLDAYLKTMLGIENGIDAYFLLGSGNQTRKVSKLITYGSTEEDYGPCRRSTHFHVEMGQT